MWYDYFKVAYTDSKSSRWCIAMSKDKEDENMSPITKTKLEEANKKFEKVLPDLWEKAKKNTEEEKKKYNSKNGGK